jgi:putative FmdB family regulatory protein
MPLYGYRCPVCEFELEELHGRDEAPVIVCHVCNSDMRKCMSPGKFKFKAGDFFEPFTTEDITGEPVLVKSQDHLRQMCRERNLTPKWGPEKLR